MILGYLKHIERNDFAVRAEHMILGYVEHIERNDFGVRVAHRME